MTRNVFVTIIRLGFRQEVIRMQAHRCPLCDQPVSRALLTDKLSQQEFDISGLCQACQDAVFRP